MSVRRHRFLSSVAIVGASAWVNSAQAQFLADSVADYSGVQGQRGWMYGYYAGTFNPDGFIPLPSFGLYNPSAWSRTCNCAGGLWLWVGAGDLGHPNGLNGNEGRLREVNWAVRRWVCDRDGPATITARLRKDDTNACCGQNGVTGHLIVDGVEVWNPSIAATDSIGVTQTFDVCLVEGSIIDFALDPRENNDGSDRSVFGFTVRGPIETPPADVFTCPRGSASFSVTTSGFGPYTFRWQIEDESTSGGWRDLENGPVTRNGEPIGTAQGARTSTLTLGAFDPAFALRQRVGRANIRCIVSSDCPPVITPAVNLTVCPANFNCDDQLDTQDFFDFVQAFLSASLEADFDGSGFINSSDYFEFVNAYFPGC